MRPRQRKHNSKKKIGARETYTSWDLFKEKPAKKKTNTQGTQKTRRKREKNGQIGREEKNLCTQTTKILKFQPLKPGGGKETSAGGSADRTTTGGKRCLQDF